MFLGIISCILTFKIQTYFKSEIRHIDSTFSYGIA